MRKKTLKAVTIAACAGMLFQFGGCLNLGNILTWGAVYAGFEFVTDNDAVFDLFGDSA